MVEDDVVREHVQGLGGHIGPAEGGELRARRTHAVPRRERHGRGPRRGVQPHAALGRGEEVVDDDTDDGEVVGTEGAEP
eukprot:scaffold13913_cov64-Phaeocystis_antarctica.AAC.4